MPQEEAKKMETRSTRSSIKFVDGPLVTLFKRIAKRQRRKKAEREAFKDASSAEQLEPGSTRVLSVKTVS
jgi:hypothetical protein